MTRRQNRPPSASTNLFISTPFVENENVKSCVWQAVSGSRMEIKVAKSFDIWHKFLFKAKSSKFFHNVVMMRWQKFLYERISDLTFSESSLCVSLRSLNQHDMNDFLHCIHSMTIGACVFPSFLFWRHWGEFFF